LNEVRAVLDYLRIAGAEGKDFAVALQDAFEDCRAGKNVRLKCLSLVKAARCAQYRIGCEAIRNA
jgi:hypothetical protein